MINVQHIAQNSDLVTEHTRQYNLITPSPEHNIESIEDQYGDYHNLDLINHSLLNMD